MKSQLIFQRQHACVLTEIEIIKGKYLISSLCTVAQPAATWRMCDAGERRKYAVSIYECIKRNSVSVCFIDSKCCCRCRCQPEQSTQCTAGFPFWNAQMKRRHKRTAGGGSRRSSPWMSELELESPVQHTCFGKSTCCICQTMQRATSFGQPGPGSLSLSLCV